MSIAKCERCGSMVDTDADEGAYVPISAVDWECRCFTCREGDDLSADDNYNSPTAGLSAEINRRNSR